MESESTSERPRPRPEPRLAAPLGTFDLQRELDEIRREPLWESRGHNAKTLVKHADLRIVLISLRAGQKLKEHAVDGAMSLQVLSGRIRFRIPGAESLELTAGSLLGLEAHAPHDVEAIEDTAMLLGITAQAGVTGR